ncbi:hypothetical protein COB57_04170 [Candidatus Peregrinibacteria bacterium]|nr:MAG: hypothetical protein COB57_04170 [Candidatus Peregrinibacteria bacterium]
MDNKINTENNVQENIANQSMDDGFELSYDYFQQGNETIKRSIMAIMSAGAIGVILSTKGMFDSLINKI